MAKKKSIRPWVLWATILLAAPAVMAADAFQNGDFTSGLNEKSLDAQEDAD